MSILRNILDRLPIKVAYAHCDVPCGIYDPYNAQVAAHTVVRMADLIANLDKNDPEFDHKLSRYISVKEESAELVKHEVRIIWGDFMKPEHLEKVPDLNDLVWGIMKKGSAARQTSSQENARALLSEVQKFAEAFWKIKGKSTRRVPSNFPSGGELVIPE